MAFRSTIEKWHAIRSFWHGWSALTIGTIAYQWYLEMEPARRMGESLSNLPRRRVRLVWKALRSFVANGVRSVITEPRRARAYWRGLLRAIVAEPLAMDLREVSVERIDPAAPETPVSLLDYCYKLGNMPPSELSILCSLAKSLSAKRIFEIGTFLGETSLQLAVNTGAEILTLDLPRSEQGLVNDPDLDVYPEAVGKRFVDDEMADQIHQLYGDSLYFDFAPYKDSIDLVLVDANHDYQHVISDSRNALLMVRGGGLIVWHDYAAYALGVVKALNELSRHIDIVRIRDTSIAVHRHAV